MSVIKAIGLRKKFGQKVVLNGIDLTVGRGRVVGIVGPNGAGKTTVINAILGLTQFDGYLSVLGRNPWLDRDALMQEICFIADVAVLPRWLRVDQAINYVQGVHPRFDRDKALEYLEQTNISPRATVRSLSKGMVAQLHLALVLAIDVKVLVLDEPTLGLDVIHCNKFYNFLKNNYHNSEKTIIITTHYINEVQEMLTDLIIINDGRIILDISTDALAQRFSVLAPRAKHTQEAMALGPLYEHLTPGRSIMLFDGVEREILSLLGDVCTPSLADLFVMLSSKPIHRAEAV